MILNALSEKSLPVYGKGLNVRDWLYVRDHCRAVWTIMQHGALGETYNIGGRCEMKNIELVEILCDILDKITPANSKQSRRQLIQFVKDRPGHDLRYAIDFSKIEKELSWKPVESFETGIRKTVQWYLDNTAWIQRVQSGEYRQWIEQQYS
jgi:dTDP-glucose 4,6-dehydratase